MRPPTLRRVVAVLVAACAALTAACGGTPRTASAPSSPPSTTATAPATDRTTTTTTTSASPPHATATTRITAPPPPSAPSSATAATVLPVVPLVGPQPTVRLPRNPPAVGQGANAVVGPVPDGLWARMVGYSWTPGCPVGRAALRSVSVNFWGFDGRRSRGTIVVNAELAAAVAGAFTDLYAERFRIRQMRPMDSTWGHHPVGPGANDYAAMRADNTSAFNCRYVGGEESRKVYSRHAWGMAVDVNDFENPYVTEDGTVYPNPYYLHRRSGAGVFTSARAEAVRAFTRRGLRWDGLASPPDFQHFTR